MKEDPTPHSAENAPVQAQTDIEMKWFREVYQGDDMPQLTVRAVLMGSFLGSIMALSNLYVGLKTGWSLGVAITACILSFSIYRALMALLPRYFTQPMSLLENNCMQSTATSAGCSTAGTMISAISAYLLVTGHHLAWPTLLLWIFFLASLGVFLAVPFKRQMINIEQLKFPSGIAAAETLRSLHSQGKDALTKARALGIAGLTGAVLTWFRDAAIPFGIPSLWIVPGSIKGFALSTLTISLETSTLMYAAGAIIGWKVAWSLLAGAVINYTILAPALAAQGVIDSSNLGFRAIITWSTWTGSSIMVSSALTVFLLQSAMIKNALVDAVRLAIKGGRRHGVENPMARIEVPGSWFAVGALLSGAGCVGILYFAFDTSILMGIVAVLLTFVLGLVACRATGESDITPIGAMGKITQLTFGILAPSRMVTNLMTAAVTAGAATAAADLLTDLKSGYLLGANPRKQFIAQYLGIFVGTLVIVPAFYLLVPSAAALGTQKWPAPAAQVWAAVARLLQTGFSALHPTAQMGIAVGLTVGAILPLAEALLPERLRRFVPSPMGLGIAMVISFFNSLSMFLGALIVLILSKKAPAIAEKYTIPVASGLIAGESIMGVVIAMLSSAGWIG